jgi:type VI secretion system protein ImpG
MAPRPGGERAAVSLDAPAVRPVGFADEDAVLPVTLRSFQGYRLLQEYFAFPQRFRFADVRGLARALARLDATEVELVLLFGRADPTLEHVVDGDNVALFCAPAVNLFEKRADRIHVDDSTFEFHVVPDRTRPLDFEVYQVTEVIGHGVGAGSEQEFLPFYTAYSADEAGHSHAYFTTRRQLRLLTTEQRRKGVRSSYVGTETFISLVDPMQAPFSGDLRQLSLRVLCTNRDLVLHMPNGQRTTDFTLDSAAPVERIRIVSGPSRPAAPVADGPIAWRAVSHLSLNYLSLVDASAEEGAAALRELLELYASHEDPSARKQIDGIRSVTINPVVRRLPPPAVAPGTRRVASTLAFGRGLEIVLDVDEMAFAGGSAFVLGAVLNHYFARHVSINSFTELVLRSQARGEINRWATEWGVRPTL